MKLLTKTALKTFEDKDIKDGENPFTVGKALSEILLTAETGGKMKLFILAQKCYKEEQIDLDQADLGIVKKAVEETKAYNNLITGQLLVILNKTNEK